MAKKKPVEDDNHVVRFVRKNHLRRDGNNQVLGVNFTAFQLREGEPYLSACCLEYAAPQKQVALAKLKKCFVDFPFQTKKCGFTLGNVRAVKDTCVRKSKIRVVHEPKGWNGSYVAVRQFPTDIEVLEELAALSWADWLLLDDL